MDPAPPVGTHLGRYEILSQLGVGGMGEVYLGRDTELGRKVALKILPASIAQNKLRLSRFIQEARTRDGRQLALARGTVSNDVVQISNFK